MLKRFFFLFILVSSSAFAASPLYENQIIETIEVVIVDPSNLQQNPNSVRMLIQSREGDHFSQSGFDADLKALAQEFYRVDPQLDSVDGKMQITLKVWPKPQIRNIYWEGTQRMGAQFLQKELDVHVDTPFDRQQFNQAFHKMKAQFVRKGFFEAQIEYTVMRDPQTNEVDITITIEEGRAGNVRDIRFCNFTPEEECEILDMMMTKKYNFFTGWMTGEGIYNQDMIDQDRYVIINYLQNQGFADANATINVDCVKDINICKLDASAEFYEPADADQIVITITADKGSSYKFGSITVEGNVLYSTEELHKVFLISEGAPYSPEALRTTAKNIMDYYGMCGYIDCYVDYEPKLDDWENLSYSVHFNVIEGEQYHVGLIKVFGNCSTQTKVILHETLLCPGEVFNLAKLQRTEQRLLYSGLFKSVNVYAVKSEGVFAGLDGNFRDVHIEVEETSTGNFGASLGFSTAENGSLGFNISERNFNICGISRVFQDGLSSLRGGGEYMSFNATLGKQSHSYVLSWTKPHFLDTQWSVGVDFDYSTNSYISDDYDISSRGATLHASYQYNPWAAISWHYRFKWSNVKIPDSEDAIKLSSEAKNSGLLAGFGASIIYNTTNHPALPTSGLKTRLQLEHASLSNNRSFIGLGFTNTYYHQLAKQHVLKFRGDMRFLTLLGGTDVDDLPLDERFFLGGENTIRGYRSYKLGPKFKACQRDLSKTASYFALNEDCGKAELDLSRSFLKKKTDEPSGGISLQLLSAEYIYTPAPIVDLYAFFDMGHLTDSQWTVGGHYYTSVGIGTRLYVMGEGSPPVTIGYGFPLNPKERNERKNFFLTVGGRF